MTDDLPIDVDDEMTSEDEGAGVWTWLLAAGGVVAAIWILSVVFNFLVWLTGYALQAAVVLLALYAIYRGVHYLLTDDSTAQSQTKMPDEADIQGELDDLTADELGGTELEDIEASVEEEVQLDDASVGSDEEDELERKFAELEQEMSQK